MDLSDQNNSSIESLKYAGFWPRLGSALIDLLVLIPFIAVRFWGESQFRLFELYFWLPNVLFFFFYHVYLVRRFGGTPGKLAMGIRIRKVNGDPVAYREAILRHLVDLIFGILVSAALVYSVFQMTDAEYFALPFRERVARQVELAPLWLKPLDLVQKVWVWGELIVLLTNRKRRALHDFIAGTVVVYARHDDA